MTSSLRSCVLLTSALALAIPAAGQGSGDYDKRSTMPMAASPSQDQMDALAGLRDELEGDLVESIDVGSGVTRSLYNPVGKLTPPNGGDPVTIALEFAQNNLTLLGLAEGDLTEIEVCDVVYSGATGRNPRVSLSTAPRHPRVQRAAARQRQPRRLDPERQQQLRTRDSERGDVERRVDRGGRRLPRGGRSSRDLRAPSAGPLGSVRPVDGAHPLESRVDARRTIREARVAVFGAYARRRARV